MLLMLIYSVSLKTGCSMGDDGRGNGGREDGREHHTGGDLREVFLDGCIKGLTNKA